MGKSRKLLNLSTKEIALVSVFSAVWVAAQIYLGPTVGQVTKFLPPNYRVHGVIQRLVGCLLMLVLAELTGKFGRVSIMATVAALATRIIRRSASLYIWMVGLGYALGGLTFDALFFISGANNPERKNRKVYLLTISLISGVLALVPYVLFKFFTFGFPAFVVWIPTYIPKAVILVILNVLGTLIGLSILPLIKPSSMRIRIEVPNLSKARKLRRLLGRKILPNLGKNLRQSKTL